MPIAKFWPSSARPSEPVVLSVNYPARLASAGSDGGAGLAGLDAAAGAASVLTRAGRRDYPRMGETEAADGEWAEGEVRKMWLFGEPDAVIPDLDGSLGTDIGALKAGLISVTPLSFALELSDLSPGFQSFLGRLTESFPLGDALASSGGGADGPGSLH